MAPEVCPNCGAVVPRNARACPGCGADEHTGWSDSAYADQLGIPDEKFDYDEFVQAEFGAARVRPRGIHWVWWLTALLLVLLFLFYYLH
jgi:RNA polymerase subunit RPABC4/transcription elongation factor Spt4